MVSENALAAEGENTEPEEPAVRHDWLERGIEAMRAIVLKRFAILGLSRLVLFGWTLIAKNQTEKQDGQTAN
jgi:hypothetical protein